MPHARWSCCDRTTISAESPATPPREGAVGKTRLDSILGVILLRWLLRALMRVFVRGSEERRRERFWTRQGISLFTALLIVLGIASIGLDDTQRLTTAAGLVTAGLAFALQKVVTTIAGYFVIRPSGRAVNL